MRETLPRTVAQRAIIMARRTLAEEEEEDLGDALADLLAPHGLLPHLREDDAGATLVCYPADWATDGTIDRDAIEDLDRAIELPVTGSTDREWQAIDEENRAIAAAVRAEHGKIHGANALAFAAFMSNHRARPIAHATDDDVSEFLQEFYPRNVWPNADEASRIEESVSITRSMADDDL